MKGVKSEALNAECSFEASLELDNTSGLPLTATIGFFRQGTLTGLASDRQIIALTLAGAASEWLSMIGLLSVTDGPVK